MDNSSKIISVLLTTVGFLLFAKVFGKYFFDFLYGQLKNKKKKKKVSFDLLVQREKFKLGAKPPIENNAQRKTKTIEKVKDTLLLKNVTKSEAYYQQKLNQSDFKEISKQDLIKINHLFQNAESRSHPLFKSLSKNISNEIGKIITLKQILIEFKTMKEVNIFEIEEKQFMNFQQIYSYFVSFFFLSELIVETQNENGDLLKNLKNSYSTKIIYLSLVTIFLDKKYSPLSKLIQALTNPQNYKKFSSELSSSDIIKRLRLFSLDKKSTLLKKIETRIILVNIVYPLVGYPKEQSLKLSWAKNIFQIKEIPDQKELKKKFRLIAKERHPDKLSGLTSNQDLLQMATKNFYLINEAFETLKNY